MDAPFWETKTLDELSPDEWEALCDGCGKCCLLKLEDEDTGDIHVTDVACLMLDGETCQCSNYPDRKRFVPDCVSLDPEAARTLSWLPSTCAYRLRAQGKPLEWWHPLVSGDPDTVHQAGISVRHRVLSEPDVDEEDLPCRIVTWPL